MIPTFSVNPDKYNNKRLKQVQNLCDTADLTKPQNRENLADAYFKVMEREVYNGKVNMDAFANQRVNKAKLKELKKAKTQSNILSKDEMEDGYPGYMDEGFGREDPGIEEINERGITPDECVKFFLDDREIIFLKRGIDIWRLLYLSMQNDKYAQRKFRRVVEEEGILENTLTLLRDKDAMKKLEAMRECSHSQSMKLTQFK